MKFWLMKTEPNEFSIEDLKKNKSTLWEGVRNYQARNFMTNDMKVGDKVFIYHSSCEEPGIYGEGQVSKIGLVDQLQFDKKSEYFDEKSTREKPRWFCCEVSFLNQWKKPFLLSEIRQDSRLNHLALLKPGQRLSIQPLEKEDFLYIQQKNLL